VIKVLVVDDSPTIRRLITMALREDREIDVVGVAVNGLEAIARVDELAPDVVTLDIEMPELDGLGALRRIRVSHPRLPVIMFSTLTQRGAITTLEALSLGASDYVTKPSNTGSVAESIESVRSQLVPKIKALAGVRRVLAAEPPKTRPLAAETVRPPEVLVIGASTGGPDALSRLLSELPADLGVPVLVVQHMPPVFTAMLAERLDRVCPLAVTEATDDAVLLPGMVVIAPGDHHLRLGRTAGVLRTHLDQGPQENFCRPAVDTLFRSVHETVGGRAVAVVLTGMGQDGTAGCGLLARSGARIVVQDEATSVVWGMPGAVAHAGLAHEVLPLERIAARLTTLVRLRRAG